MFSFRFFWLIPLHLHVLAFSRGIRLFVPLFFVAYILFSTIKLWSFNTCSVSIMTICKFSFFHFAFYFLPYVFNCLCPSLSSWTHSKNFISFVLLSIFLFFYPLNLSRLYFSFFLKYFLFLLFLLLYFFIFFTRLPSLIWVS